jgi:hypothetical protein
MEINGVLLDRHEWAGGLTMKHKEVSKAQTSRKREVKKGFAKIVKFT